VTCIDPIAKDRVSNYKCTCIVCKSTDQSALDCDGAGGGVRGGQRGEEGEETDEEGVEPEGQQVGNRPLGLYFFALKVAGCFLCPLENIAGHF
jgi:hypothetical protein